MYKTIKFKSLISFAIIILFRYKTNLKFIYEKDNNESFVRFRLKFIFPYSLIFTSCFEDLIGKTKYDILK